MILLHILNFGLIAFCFLFPALAFPFQDSALTSFQVQGNLNVHVRPDETSRIILSAVAEGPGILDVRVGGVKPSFIDWDSRQLECSGPTCSISDTIYFTPTFADYGPHSFSLIARFIVNGKTVSEQNRRVRINVTPIALSEPAFSKGSSNEVCWGPFDQRFQYELLLKQPLAGSNFGAPDLPGSSDSVVDACETVENLPEGVRLGYFVRTRDLANGRQFDSNVVYSTQDKTPPPGVSVERFSLEPTGRRLTLEWPSLPDETSYVDSYVIERQPFAGNAPFASRDTLAFFPIRHISPISYYPVETNVGHSLYVDSPNADSTIAAKFGNDFEIDWLPMAKLAGSAMIKTGVNDRWNTEDEFLSFELVTASWIYIAYDYDQLNFSVPEWLSSSFQPLGKSVSANGNRVPLFKSRQIFQPGKVILGGNFARGASLVHKEPLMYVVFVQPVDEILPFVAGDRIIYDELLDESDDGSTFRYRISVIDGAGNVAVGPESGPIIADLSSKCKPHPTRWSDFEARSGHFSRGLSNVLTILNPTEDLECVGFRDTDSLRFQAAREFVGNFNSTAGTTNPNLFDSGWIHANDLQQPWGHRFELLPSGADTNFVNGKTYFYRVRAKDRFNNFSVWSDTVASTQDAFPPQDINGLGVETLKFFNGAKGCNQLTWQGGEDFISGTRAFVIYRRISSGAGFSAIDSIAGSEFSYCDSLANFARNDIVTYRIGSVDNVGNTRDAENTSHEVTTRALVGPTIQFDQSALLKCADGRTRVALDSIAVFWQNYDATDLAGFEVEVGRPDGSKTVSVLFDGPATRVNASMDAGDGIYRFRVRAFYVNRDTTLFSNSLIIRRKVSLASATRVLAEQDQEGTGNILLSWTHPEMAEIEQFRIFAWGENEEVPDTPAAVVSGEITDWVHEFSSGNLTAYQCTNYAIQARDCFGLLSEVESLAVQYSNPPLVFDQTRTEVSDTDITICWNRPEPGISARSFETTVTVYEDSISSQPFATFKIADETCFTFRTPQEKHNYIFRVRENVLSDPAQSCADSFSGSASGTTIVPFKNLPETVKFYTQALPVHPDSTTGRVFLRWDMAANEKSKFLIQYRSSGLAGPTEIELEEADTLQVVGLDISETYDFDIFAIDSLGQRSLMTPTQSVSFSPRWLFTPSIAQINPGCFRDSVAVIWQWLDELLAIAPGNFGADSVIVEVSVDSSFRSNTSEKRFSTAVFFSGAFYLDRDLQFLNSQDNRLYVRLRAKDHWGHISPWSTTYPELGAALATFDDVPPAPAFVKVDSIKAPILGSSGIVDVYLSWQDVADNCSGTWFYEIVRGDSVVGQDTSRTASHAFIERNLKNDETLLSQSWRVFAIDSVGNRQIAAERTTIPSILAAPDSGWCFNDSTFCWSPSAQTNELQVSYIVEGARSAELLGNTVTPTNFHAGPIDSLCVSFDLPWEKVFWRVKAKFGILESAWSETFFCDLGNRGPIKPVLLSQTLGILPAAFSLAQNYPNPFNPETTIEYAIPAAKVGGPVLVRLDVFNLKGQKVRSLVNEQKTPANYSIVWDGRDDFGRAAGSGVYIYRIQTDNFIQSRKMLLVK